MTERLFRRRLIDLQIVMISIAFVFSCADEEMEVTRTGDPSVKAAAVGNNDNGLPNEDEKIFEEEKINKDLPVGLFVSNRLTYQTMNTVEVTLSEYFVAEDVGKKIEIFNNGSQIGVPLKLPKPPFFMFLGESVSLSLSEDFVLKINLYPYLQRDGSEVFGGDNKLMIFIAGSEEEKPRVVESNTFEIMTFKMSWLGSLASMEAKDSETITKINSWVASTGSSVSVAGESELISRGKFVLFK